MRWVYPLVIVVACLAAYANIFGGPFVFDDIPSIVQNPHIRSLTPLAKAAGLGLKDDITIAGRPIPAVTFALNYAISGLEIWSYRATNLLIHVAAALLLLGIVRRTLRMPACGDRFGRHADILALVVALLWAVHPLQPTSVTYVVQRVESLMGMFALLTLYAVIRAAEGRRRGTWTIVAVMSCGLGMGCKEVMAVVPVLVLLYDRTLLAGSFARALRERAGLYVGLAATWALLAVLVLTGPRAGIAAGLAAALSPVEYLRIQMWAIPRYLRLCFWPSDLALDYGNTTIGVELPLSMTVVVAGAVLLVALAIGTAVAVWRNRPIGFLGAWFFLFLAPSSSVIPLPFEPAAEHRMYLPLAAVTALVAFGADRLLAGSVGGARVGIVVALIAAVSLGVRTQRRNALFADEIQLWSADVQQNGANVRVRTNLALALATSGDNERAMEQYGAALAVRPTDPEALIGMGNALLLESKFEESAAFSRKAIEVKPKSAEALSNLGEACRCLGRAGEAVGCFQRSLALDPKSGATRAGLADALGSLGRCAEAEAHYRAALETIPDDATLHLNLARCLVALGRKSEAIERLRAAATRLPNVRELRAALDELARSGPAETP